MKTIQYGEWPLFEHDKRILERIFRKKVFYETTIEDKKITCPWCEEKYELLQLPIERAITFCSNCGTCLSLDSTSAKMIPLEETDNLFDWYVCKSKNMWSSTNVLSSNMRDNFSFIITQLPSGFFPAKKTFYRNENFHVYDINVQVLSNNGLFPCQSLQEAKRFCLNLFIANCIWQEINTVDFWLK